MCDEFCDMKNNNDDKKKHGLSSESRLFPEKHVALSLVPELSFGAEYKLRINLATSTMQKPLPTPASGEPNALFQTPSQLGLILSFGKSANHFAKPVMQHKNKEVKPSYNSQAYKSSIQNGFVFRI